MTEREKIIEIIAPFVSAYGEDEAIADACIAANIGDVTEWKERAEKAEKDRDAWKNCAQRWQKHYHEQQAEREIEEEKVE